MGLGKSQDSLGNVRRRLVATRCKAGPVVEVDDADGTVRIDDAITAIDDDIQLLGGARADVLQLLEVDVDALAMAIHLFPAILAVPLIKGVKPVEELRILHAIELHQVTLQVHIDHRACDATIEVLLEHLLSLLGMAHIADVLLVHGMEISALDPARLETGFLELRLDILVGVDNETLGIRDAIAQQDARHALACTVLNAIARVNHQLALVLKALQLGDALALTAHGQHDGLFYLLLVELLLAVNIDLATTLAQLLGDQIEDGRVVTNMIGRICPSAHYARYCDVCHY